MTGQAIADLVSQSIKSPKVQDVLRLFGLEAPQPRHYSTHMAWNEASGIAIDFRPQVAFEQDFLEPPHRFAFSPSSPLSEDYLNSESMELLVESVTFERGFREGLPFGLSFEGAFSPPDEWEPYSKEKSGETHHWHFLFGTFRILASLDKDKKLKLLRVWPIENRIKNELKRKESLKSQSKNIDPASVEKIMEISHFKPIDLWRERMEKGNSLFSEESVAQSELSLTKFIAAAQKAAEKKSAEKIWSATEAVVKDFNKLSRKYRHIDTQEREELAKFIKDIVKATGFHIDEKEDITQEWRQW